MKFIAALAIASALHLENNKAPHEELIQAGTKVAQYYGFDPANYVTQGYSWTVVGDVKLAQVVSTFANTAPAAYQVWYKVQAWGGSLQSNWYNTLQQAASANNVTNATSYNSSSYSPYYSTGNYSNYTGYNASNSSSWNSSNYTTVGNSTASTGTKHCYYTASLNTRCSSTTCTNWCDRQNGYSNARSRCLNNSYGGVDYGCRWGYGTSTN